MTGEFPAQRASDAENVSIWWRHHEIIISNAPHIAQHSSDEGWTQNFQKYLFIKHTHTQKKKNTCQENAFEIVSCNDFID